jgi:branched-chain amino acid transport system substrate-binding protein
VSPLDRRQLLRLFGAVGAAGATAPALSACSTSGPAAAPTGPVRIGLIIPQTGANKPVGDELNAGFQLYLKLHGNQLGGRPAQIATVDEGESADSGRAAVDRLVKESVHVMSGVASSTVMTAIRDQVEAAQVPLLGSAASPSSLASVKYIWRTSYVNTDPSTALGGYLAGRQGESVLVVSEDSAAAREQVGGFLAAFNGALGHPDLAGPVQITPGGSFSQIASAIRGSGVRKVFAVLSGDGAAAFLRGYRSSGLTLPLYSPGFVTEGGDALQRLGEPALGLYTAMNYGPGLDNPANRMFAAEYERTYGHTASTYAMASYDAAAAVDRALRFTGSDLTPQAVNAALSSVGQLDSPRGGWQFSQSRTPLQRWYLRQVRRDGAVIANTVLGDIGMLG